MATDCIAQLTFRYQGLRALTDITAVSTFARVSDESVESPRAVPLTGLPSLRRREKVLSEGIPRYGSARDLRSWRLWAIGFLGAEATEG
jgi:hypothetical protein